MQPDNNPSRIITPGSTPSANAADGTSTSSPPNIEQPTAVPTISTPPKQPKSKKRLVITLVILGLLIAGGAAAYWFLIREKDEPEVSTSQTVQESEPETSKIPEGFTEYNNEAEGIAFIYPEAWGRVIVEPGPEQKDGHLTAGNELVFKFLGNERISAGVKSNDWSHDENMGHGGSLYAGEIKFDQVKENAGRLESPAQVYVNTDNQVAYVHECVDFCSLDSPYLLYTVKLKEGSNLKYDNIQFLYHGDKFGAEYYVDDKDSKVINSAIITPEVVVKQFPKTDSRFLQLQKIADYITSQTN